MNIYASRNNFPLYNKRFSGSCDGHRKHRASSSSAGQLRNDETSTYCNMVQIIITIIIIIIIMSRYQHGYLWPFLAIPLYRPLLLVGLQGYIPYRHKAAVCWFTLVVLPLLVHVKGSIGVHHL